MYYKKRYDNMRRILHVGEYQLKKGSYGYRWTDMFGKRHYHLFMDEAYKLSDRVELIHPAKFLFNAGATPKAWNEKMLSDPHFKILEYSPDSRTVFGSNVSISGGVAISYHDNTTAFGEIGVFSSFPELTGILDKTTNTADFISLETIIFIQTRLDLDVLYLDHPEYEKKCGKDPRLERNIFEKLDCFSEQKLNDSDIKVLGIENRKRTWKYINCKYIDFNHENLCKYKIYVSTSTV